MLLSFAQASEVRRIEVASRDGSYRISMAVHIAAPLDEVWTLISDPRNLARLSPDTRESVLLSPASSGRERVRVVLHPCLLMFCRELVKVSEVDYPSPHRIP